MRHHQVSPSADPRSRRRRAHRAPDGGVTVVVGILLAIGLVVALLVNYRLQWVPLAMEDAQAAHMATVNGEMGAFVATLDKQLIGQVNTTVSSPFTVGVPAQSFPTMPPVSHALRLQSATSTGYGYELSSSQLRLVERNETTLAGLSETYDSIPASGSTTIVDVAEVHHMRLRLETVSAGNAGSSLSLQITDAAGDAAGYFTLGVEDAPGPTNYTIRYTTYEVDGTGDPIFEQAYFQEQGYAPFFVNLLHPDLQIDQLLAAAAAPVDLTFTGAGLDGGHSTTYTGDDGIVRAAGGPTETDWSRALPSGSLTYAGANPEYVDQDLIVENGALLVSQRDGVGFLTSPRFSTQVTGNLVLVSLTVPQLEVPDEQVAGVTDVTVKSTTASSGSLSGWATDLAVTVTTDPDHVQAWSNYFTQAMTDAAVPTTYWSVATGADTVTLTMDGANTDATEDVFLTLRYTLIRAEVFK